MRCLGHGIGATIVPNTSSRYTDTLNRGGGLEARRQHHRWHAEDALRSNPHTACRLFDALADCREATSHEAEGEQEKHS